MRFRRAAAILAVTALSMLGAGPAWACVYEPPEVCYETRDNPDYVPAYDDEDTIIPAVPGQWWNWSPNKDQGPFEGPPDFPSDERGTWQGPHTEGGPEQDAVGTYQVGNGNGDWFHREAGTPEQVIEGQHHDAVGEPTIQVEVPCEEEPIEVTPFLDFTPPTCDEPGSLGLMSGPESGVIWGAVGNPDGSSVYTASAAPGFVFPEGAIVEFIVPNLAQLPEDSDECYVPPPPPVCEDEDVPVWHVWTGGPVESDEGPSANDPAWNANSGNPQSANHAFENHEPGVPYFVSHGNSGKGDWFLWTLEDCPPPPTDIPVAVLFDIEPTPPTCDVDGSLPNVFPIVREGYSITVDREFDGPGEYTLTATAADGFVFSGEGDPIVRTATVWVDAALGYQSEDPEADCYLPPPPPECVDINTAGLDDLARITNLDGEGILAQRVIDGRPYASLDDLLKVDGIGPVTLAEIKADADLCPLVTPPPPGPPAPPAPPAPPVVHQPPVTPTYLASTGSDGSGWIALAAAGLTMLGGTALALRRRLVSIR